jgi:predicted peptidase
MSAPEMRACTGFSFFAFLALMACVYVMPKKARAAEAHTVHSFERTVTHTIGYKYLLALPTGYSARGERRWPLLLFLHGSGERGNDVWSVANHGPPELLKSGGSDAATRMLAENFIVVSPQCPKNKWWDTEALVALLDEIVPTHPIDRGRVYLTGLSMGGFGAWHLGLSYPERFAAIAPICGGGDFPTIHMSDTHKRAPLRSLAVWAFHGAKDRSVPLDESQRMVAALKEHKVEEVKLTVYPDAEHNSWTRTYENPDLYAWLLRHARKVPPEAK